MKTLNELGCGQAIIRDNVFESGDGRSGGIVVDHGSRQVCISNNMFIGTQWKCHHRSVEERSVQVPFKKYDHYRQYN